MGGNAEGMLQCYTVQKNEIGEGVKNWQTRAQIKGYLDLIKGDSVYDITNSKISESTHVFLADYVPLEDQFSEENSRMIIDNKIYEILYIDNPMGLNRHLEIYLKRLGG